MAATSLTPPAALERPADLVARAALVLQDPGQTVVDPAVAAPLAGLLRSLLTARDLAGSPPPAFEHATTLARAVIDGALDLAAPDAGLDR